MKSFVEPHFQLHSAFYQPKFPYFVFERPLSLSLYLSVYLSVSLSLFLFLSFSELIKGHYTTGLFIPQVRQHECRPALAQGLWQSAEKNQACPRRTLAISTGRISRISMESLEYGWILFVSPHR